jgi:GT2 family glycosyltransferase
MSSASAAISVVLPTYNRLGALQASLPALQAMHGVVEIIVVVDGSSDGTAEWLAAQEDPRIRTVLQPQQGSPAARNHGIDVAGSPWILMTEDDCFLPADFATTLLAVATTQAAQIVSAPWLTVGEDASVSEAIANARAHSRSRIGLQTHPGVFPRSDCATPFLNGIFLAHRSVFEAVRYRSSFGGNAWREETDLFLNATERGFRCVLTPRTASLQLGQWDGGQRRSRLGYEAWAIRNNWAFLRHHASALQALGQIRDPVTAQAAFVGGRVASVVLGFMRARWRRVIGLRLGHSADEA